MPVAVIKVECHELLLAGVAGVMREVENIKRQRQQTYGSRKGEGWGRHVTGCIGELVIAKHRNRFWAGKGRLRDFDVDGHQVRYAPPGGHLLLHPDDADDDVFWLVRGCDQHYTVEGWLYGREGKVDQFWLPDGYNGNKRPAFFVPASVLHTEPPPEA